jgi:hypothetical protein
MPVEVRVSHPFHKEREKDGAPGRIGNLSFWDAPEE